MKCERCLSTDGKNAEFRVRSDILDLKVCPRCAVEARVLGLAIEPLHQRDWVRDERSKEHDGVQTFVG
jgi:hypothetical protein